MASQEDDVDVEEIDVAAAMGFASFGDQRKNKRQKIDIGVAPTTDQTIQQTQSRISNTGDADKAITQPARPPRPPRNDLEALRRGVRNGRGDMTYFKPSFIDDDPWKHLINKKS